MRNNSAKLFERLPQATGDALRDENEAYTMKLVQMGSMWLQHAFWPPFTDFAILNALADTPAQR